MTRRADSGAADASTPESASRGGRGRLRSSPALRAGLSGVLAGLLCAVAAPSPIAAQDPPDSVRAAPPDSGRAAPDTVPLTPLEEMRRRQRERLERLSRDVGSDTLNLISTDSVQALARAEAQRAQRARSDAGGDSIITRLRQELQDYTVYEYEARSAYFDAETRDLELAGDTLQRPSLLYEGQRVTADSLIQYNEAKDALTTGGRATIQPVEGDALTADRLVVDTRSQAASAFGAETTYNEGARWEMSGDLPRVYPDSIFGGPVRFTSCDHDPPHYYFLVDELKIVRGHRLVARPVKLYFGDVPVAWLPFMAQSLERGRASGLLTPRFSVNDIVRTSGGYRRRISNVGFYWAMSDYTDATVALDWFDDNYTAVTASLQYQWLRQFLSGRVNARQFWRAQGGSELTLDAQHQWEISERTSMNASISYASSSSFVRQNSFDPREVTQEIRSQGGFNRRFDWGSLAISGSRAQSLSDDRVDLTLPSVNLSLSTVTLFPAPPTRASWYNNLAWSGGASFNRQLRDFAPQPADSFRYAQADQGTMSAKASHRVSLGNLSLSQSLTLSEGTVREVPRDSLAYFPALVSLEEANRLATLGSAGAPGELVDVSQSTLDWTTSLDYQQTLVGSTTLTPRVSLTGRAKQSDTIDVAQGFVSAPTRVSLGVQLRSDIYGLFGGFGPYEAIRHKVSPSFGYDFSPAVAPTELQTRVFGGRELQPRKALNIGFSQTFEAKRRPRDPPEEATPGAAPATGTGEEGAEDLPAPGDPPGAAGEPPVEPPVEPPGEPAAAEARADTAAAPPPQVPGAAAPGAAQDGPRRVQQGEVVTLLALRTSAVAYDFVQADSAGDFLQGFTTTRLRNEIASDFLRGLTISVEHDLFDDSTVAHEDGTRDVQRRFDPQLSALNFGFSLSASSAIVRWLGLGSGSGSADGAPTADTADIVDPFAERSATDETAMIPGGSTDTRVRDRRQPTGRRPWSASFSYALNRPRSDLIDPTQNLQISVTSSPTEHWQLSWRTSYDLERKAFNDHVVRLTRDLHRWQANFDFMQTATGNWTFRFEVSLLDNRDLNFDYQQRSLDPAARR